MGGRDHEPHPGTLARIMLDHGDAEGALQVCAFWRSREPGNSEVAALEAEARRGGIEARPLPLDQTDAERYVQQGYLDEAVEIYRRLSRRDGADRDAQARQQILEEFTHFQLSVDADPDQISAEEHISARRLPSALLDYRDLARKYPTDEGVIRRADHLRSIVLGVPPQVQAEQPDADMVQTTEMPLATKALLMLKEANLQVAAQLFQVMATRDDAAPIIGEVGAALGRLAELTSNDPLTESSDEEGTVRLGPHGFAAFHVRVGNFPEAAELYRGLVERHPASPRLRQRLDDLRTILAYLRQQGAEVEAAPPKGKRNKRLSSTNEIGLPGSKTPRPERALGKRSGAYELSAFRSPVDGEEASSVGPAPLEAVPTKRVDKREIAEIQLSRGFVDRALILFEELLAERPKDPELQARVADLKARFGTPMVDDDPERLSTQVDRPSVGRGAKAESRPNIDTRGMVDALRGASDDSEPARSASSWLPTQRVQPVSDEGLQSPPTARRRRAQTMSSRPPTVDEVAGQSFVEVPRDMPSVVERTPGRLDADEASEIGEPFGVLVRPILLIE